MYNGDNLSNQATAETLKGVGIGGNTIARNANSSVGVGTLLNGSTNQGLEVGEVMTVRRFNRLVRKHNKEEARRLRREERNQ